MATADPRVVQLSPAVTSGSNPLVKLLQHQTKVSPESQPSDDTFYISINCCLYGSIYSDASLNAVLRFSFVITYIGSGCSQGEGEEIDEIQRGL
jgi:hypothetical protein